MSGGRSNIGRALLRRPGGLSLALLLCAAPSACVPEFLFGSEVAAVCKNETLDEGETDIDCGGICSPCPLGKRCDETADCADGSCIEAVCRQPSCGDESLSPGETDIDCGGAHCAPCGELEACETDRDCLSSSCQAGRCVAALGLGGIFGDGDGDISQGGSSQAGTGGSPPGDGGNRGTGGAPGSGGEAASGGAPSGGSASGGASSGGAPSGGASSGGTGGGSVCDQTGLAFCDDFEDGDSSGWEQSGGTWDVVSSPASYVYEGGGGSEESVAGSQVWTDQRVEAKVKVIAFGGSGGSYRVGIVARFSGPSDFFTLSLDQTGSLRLLKSTSSPTGASGTCGTLSHPIDLGSWYTLRMDVSGGSGDIQIRTYVDDVLKHDCHTTQTSITAGKAGVLTVGSNTVAHFDDVTVTLL